MHSSLDIQDVASMFRPPVNRTMRVLDRSFFHKKIPLSAAKVRDRKNISKVRRELQKEILELERKQVVQDIPGVQKEVGKALLLKPEVRHDSEYLSGSGVEDFVDVSRQFNMGPETIGAGQC